MDTAHERAKPIRVDLIHSGVGDIQTRAIDDGEICAGRDENEEHEDGQCAEMIERIEIRFGETVDESFEARPEFFKETESLTLSVGVEGH